LSPTFVSEEIFSTVNVEMFKINQGIMVGSGFSCDVMIVLPRSGREENNRFLWIPFIAWLAMVYISIKKLGGEDLAVLGRF
jgi:hypothetical protein